MSKSFDMKNSFGGGEIGPLMYGRSETKQYQFSVKEMVNAYPYLEGGVTKRQGNKHIGKLPSHNSYAPKEIAFTYSRTQSYLLIIHDGKMYFIKDGAFLLDAGNKVELIVPFTDAELVDVRFVQQGNAMVFVHENHSPLKLVRISDTNWTMSTITMSQYAIADTWWKTTVSDVKIFADDSAATDFEPDQYWQWTTSGAAVTVDPVLYDSGGTPVSPVPGGCVVTRVNDSRGDGIWKATCVYADPKRSEWEIQAPDATYPILQWNAGTYPAAVDFFQQRLFFAGGDGKNIRVWGSQIEDYENFSIGANDSDAVQFAIQSKKYSPVIHLSGSPTSLSVFTHSTEYSVSGGEFAIGPKNVLIAPQSTYGAADAAPVTVGTDTIFVQRNGLKLYSVVYNMQQSQNLADELTTYAKHITASGIVDMAHAQEPDSILWAVRSDGVLLSLSYKRSEGQMAWARHPYEGNIKSVAVVLEASTDTVYMCQERTVDSVTEFYIEQVGDQLLDSYMEDTDVTAKTTWTGYDHLEGMTVDVLADNLPATGLTVTGGVIELQEVANDVVVGLNYESYVILLPPEVVSEGQTSQGRALSVDKVAIRFHETIGATYTGVNSTEQILPFTKFGESTFGDPISEFSGLKNIDLIGWSTDNTIKLGQSQPLPWTILSVVMRVTVNDM